MVSQSKAKNSSAKSRTKTPELLMPRATAMWMIDNTSLSFAQISEFTGITELRVKAMADGDVDRGLPGRNPIQEGLLSKEEIERVQADPEARLETEKRSDLPSLVKRVKGPKYTPVSKRGDKPDAIAWILKFHPEISDTQICRLIGTTRPTIISIRDRSHANMTNIKPRHPQELGLCSFAELEEASRKGLIAQGKDPDAPKESFDNNAEQDTSDSENSSENESDSGNTSGGGFDFSNFLNRSMSSSDNEDDSDNR